MPAHGIMFHHFHGGQHPVAQGSMDAVEFRRMLEFVGVDRILPAREWLDRAPNRALRDGQIILTFDDNLRCQYEVARPVLRELGLSACFFVYSSVLHGAIERLELYRHFRTVYFASVQAFYDMFYATIDAGPHALRVRQAMLRFNPRTYLSQFSFYTDADRKYRFVRDDVLGPQVYHRVMDQMLDAYAVDEARLSEQLWMTKDHLRQLHAEGHVIGLHSHTHPTKLSGLTPQQQRDEYTTNWRVIRQITGSPPTAMAHPCNSYVPYTLSILRQLGVRVGFRANIAQQAYSDFEHPREDHANLRQEMNQARMRVAA